MLHLIFQRRNLGCKLIYHLLQFFNRSGEGFGLTRSLLPDELFFGQFILSGGKGLGS
jgi:hypothetical protein